MKYLHVNAGNENGGGLTHIVSLLRKFPPEEAGLAVFEEGPVAAAARAAGISVFVFQQRKRTNFSVLSKLTAFIQQENIQVVHTHGPRANLFLTRIHKKIKARWVITVHSDPLFDFKGDGLRGRLFTNLHIYALKQADGVIAISQTFKEKLIEMGLPAAKVYVAYNGIEFHEQLPTAQPHTGFVLVMIARLHPIKRHKYLFDCLQQAQLPDWHLKLIGDGPLAAELKTTCRQKGLEQQVTFLGHQNATEIQKELGQADLTVLTSASESFPLVLLESANEGVPFIATEVGDVRKMTGEPPCSWVVPVNDQAAFVAALKEAYHLWQAGSLRQQGSCLFYYTKEHFSLDQLYQRTTEIYQLLLTNPTNE